MHVNHSVWNDQKETKGFFLHFSLLVLISNLCFFCFVFLSSAHSFFLHLTALFDTISFSCNYLLSGEHYLSLDCRLSEQTAFPHTHTTCAAMVLPVLLCPHTEHLETFQLFPLGCVKSSTRLCEI